MKRTMKRILCSLFGHTPKVELYRQQVSIYPPDGPPIEGRIAKFELHTCSRCGRTLNMIPMGIEEPSDTGCRVHQTV
jgi:hypothetical protein